MLRYKGVGDRKQGVIKESEKAIKVRIPEKFLRSPKVRILRKNITEYNHWAEELTIRPISVIISSVFSNVV